MLTVVTVVFWLQVRDVRIITDNKTRRSKGIAYVEFADVDSVPLGMGLSGQRLLGVPIIVQVRDPSQLVYASFRLVIRNRYVIVEFRVC